MTKLTEWKTEHNHELKMEVGYGRETTYKKHRDGGVDIVEKVSPSTEFTHTHLTADQAKHLGEFLLHTEDTS